MGGDLAEARRRRRSRWSLWQLVVLSGLEARRTLLPAPATVFGELWQELLATATSWRRSRSPCAARPSGFALAVVDRRRRSARSSSGCRLLRAAVGSLITGLQTMPSIAWFPLAILLFQLSETAILFVVVLGAAPSIANGLISGVDHVPPLLLRAGPGRWARRGLALLPPRRSCRPRCRRSSPGSSRAGRSPGAA